MKKYANTTMTDRSEPCTEAAYSSTSGPAARVAAPSAYPNTAVRRNPVTRDASVPSAMTPLDLTRLASSAVAGRSHAAAAASRPAVSGPLPLSAAVGPAGGAGVLIRILRWMLGIGTVRHDVIGSFGQAGRIPGVCACGGPACVRGRPACAGRWLLAPAAGECAPDRGQHEHAERGADDH